MEIFEHRLALTFGMPVDVMLDMLPPGAMQNWIRYYNTEPFGQPREEARHCRLIASLYNTAPGKVLNPKCLEPNYWKYKPPVEQSDEDMLEMMKTAIPT